MKFSDHERSLINQAVVKARRARYIKYVCVFFVVAAGLLMFQGLFGFRTFAVVMICFALFSLVEPQLHRGPSYKELADLLARKAGVKTSSSDLAPGPGDLGE